MVLLLYCLLFLALGAIVYQDIRYRHIHVVLPILIFGSVFYLNKSLINYTDLLQSVLFLGVNFAFITLYFSIKNTKVVNPFKQVIGIGDLIFLIGIVPLFSFRNYVLFFITGMLFTLFLSVIFLKKHLNATIPLAGYLSIYVLLLLSCNFFLSTNLFYSFII